MVYADVSDFVVKPLNNTKLTSLYGDNESSVHSIHVARTLYRICAKSPCVSKVVRRLAKTIDVRCLAHFPGNLL
jgi:hypothetical protein